MSGDEFTAEFRPDPVAQLQAEIKLGDKAEQFFKSELGKSLLRIAAYQINRAVLNLLRTNPTDIDTVRRLQQEATIPLQCLAWLNHIVARKIEALQTDQLEEQFSEMED